MKSRLQPARSKEGLVALSLYKERKEAQKPSCQKGQLRVYSLAHNEVIPLNYASLERAECSIFVLVVNRRGTPGVTGYVSVAQLVVVCMGVHKFAQSSSLILVMTRHRTRNYERYGKITSITSTASRARVGGEGVGRKKKGCGVTALFQYMLRRHKGIDRIPEEWRGA